MDIQYVGEVEYPDGYTGDPILDFGDDWIHQINVIGIQENVSSEKYPRIVHGTGNSPPQYPDPDEE